MKRNILAFALLIAYSTISFAKGGDVGSAESGVLYRALGGDEAAVGSGSVLALNVSAVECIRQTEKQQGDPSAAEENLTFVMCSVTNAEGDAFDYLGVNAINLESALSGAKAFKVGDSLNGSLSAKMINCTKTTKVQKSDMNFNSKVLITHSCKLQK